MKSLYLVIAVLFLSSIAFAQFTDTTQVEEPVKKESKFDKSKLYYGGYVNASFGDYTSVGLAPLVGYKLNPKLSIGGQFTYDYVKQKSDFYEDYESSSYSLSAFARYRLLPQLYGHIEYSQMNYELFDGEREWVPFLYLGGGFSQPISRNTWFTAQVLFDVINDEDSPYKEWDPQFSIGIGVGF